MRASIPIRNMGPDRFPVGIASGCLLDYGGRRWILSVAHASGKPGNWAIEMEFDEGRGMTGVYQIGAMNFMGRAFLQKGTTEALDLAYAEVPANLQPYWQPRNEQGQIMAKVPRLILQSDLTYKPERDKIYGFAGGVLQKEEDHFGKRWHSTVPVCYTELKFTGEDGQYNVFTLPFPHPGHQFFRGTSGAPILDRERNIAALVCGAGDAPDSIEGIKMEFVRVGLNVALLQPNNEDDEDDTEDQ